MENACMMVYAGVEVRVGVGSCKLVAVSLSEGRREGGKIRNRAYTARARDDVVLAKRGRRTGGQTIRCV